jgi:hypothetical protein
MLNYFMSGHDSLQEPTPYDDDGYVIRFWKGVLPSNTLNVLHGLTTSCHVNGEGLSW